jgi:hypothetical protein
VRAERFRDPAFGSEIAERLRAETGVTSAEATSLTGSLLVTYEARKVQVPWLAQLIVRLSGLDGIEVDRTGEPPGRPTVRETFGRWNGAVAGATRGWVDGRTALPGALAALSAVTFVFGKRRLPYWYDLLFWSFVTFVNLNPPAPPSGGPGDGHPE